MLASGEQSQARLVSTMPGSSACWRTGFRKNWRLGCEMGRSLETRRDSHWRGAEGVATTLFSSAWNSCELSEAKATAWAVWDHHCPYWVKQFYSQRTPTFVKCIANILWLPKFLMCQKCTKIQKITYASILISHYLIFTHDSKGAVIVCEKGLEISHIAVVSTPGELLCLTCAQHWPSLSYSFSNEDKNISFQTTPGELHRIQLVL